MQEDIYELDESLKESSLYSEDLAPIPPSQRTWSTWNLATLWIGMAVCIPTYMLAASMITDGISWLGALVIIGLGSYCLSARTCITTCIFCLIGSGNYFGTSIPITYIAQVSYRNDSYTIISSGY